jgi:hypothetical protein
MQARLSTTHSSQGNSHGGARRCSAEYVNFVERSIVHLFIRYRSLFTVRRRAAMKINNNWSVKVNNPAQHGGDPTTTESQKIIPSRAFQYSTWSLWAVDAVVHVPGYLESVYSSV